MREEQKRIEHEQMIAKMEQEELELIKRLQNTQLLQQAAYEDLENALTTKQNAPEQERPMTGAKKGTAKGRAGGARK